MRDINLIPPDTIRAQETGRRLRFWIAVNLAALIILGSASGFVLREAKLAKEAVWNLDDRLSELKSLTTEIEILRADRAGLQKEETALASLLDRAPDYGLLRTISEAVADQGWLTEMEIVRPVGYEEDEWQSGSLILQGNAGTFTHLAQLMGTLKSLDFVQEVDLKKSQLGRTGDLDVIGFEIECRLVPGP